MNVYHPGMNSMHYNGSVARIEFDQDDEVFVGRIVGVDDVISFHANEVDALKSAFHEAVDDYLETCARIGKEPQKAYSGNVMFRIQPGGCGSGTAGQEPESVG